MQELILQLIPFVLTLDKIGRHTAHMSTEDAIDLGYADSAAEAYTAIENLLEGYVSTNAQDLAILNDNLKASNTEVCKANDAQAEELTKLRDFTRRVINAKVFNKTANMKIIAFDAGFIDKDGNPTKLLTGEK